MAGKKAEAFYIGESGIDYTKRLQCLSKTTLLRSTFIFAPYINEDDTVLDFGCGSGDLLASLSASYKAGVEISPSSRKLAHSHALDVRSSLQDFSGYHFSRIISSHALEHVTNPADILKNMRNLLEDDGLLILLLPLDDWRSRAHRRWHANDIHMHLYAWTPMTIGNLLAVTGFQPTKIQIVTHTHPPRIGDQLAQISSKLYHLLAKLSAIILARRQLLVIAQPKAW